MKLEHMENEVYRLTYNDKSVDFEHTKESATLDNVDIFFILYDLIQDYLYSEHIIGNLQYNDDEDFERMKRNNKKIEDTFTIEEIEDMEIIVDEMEEQL